VFLSPLAPVKQKEAGSCRAMVVAPGTSNSPPAPLAKGGQGGVVFEKPSPISDMRQEAFPDSD